MCAWATPATAVTGAVAEAADFNNHRDNLNETSVAKVTTAGDMTYATGANALARLAIGTEGQELITNTAGTAPQWMTRDSKTDDVATSETTSSTTYTDLATAGPAVTPAPGATKLQLIIVSARMSSSDGNYVYMSPSIAGAAATDANSAHTTSSNVVMTRPTLINQNSGSTQTAKYKVANGSCTGTFVQRRIIACVL